MTATDRYVHSVWAAVEAAARSQLQTRLDDEGMGTYEFWGSPGYDSRPTLQLRSNAVTVTLDSPSLTDMILDAEQIPAVIYGPGDDGQELHVTLTLTGARRLPANQWELTYDAEETT